MNTSVLPSELEAEYPIHNETIGACEWCGIVDHKLVLGECPGCREKTHQQTEDIAKMKCSRSNCEERAMKRPVLTVTTEHAPHGPRLKLYPSLIICNDHASTDPNEYITDKSWQRLCNNLEKAGLNNPDRSTLKIDFVPLYDA